MQRSFDLVSIVAKTVHILQADLGVCIKEAWEMVP